MSPLRILVFLHSFEPGGVEKIALRLAGAWTADGADVRLVIGRAAGAMPGNQLVDVLQTGPISTARFETLWMITQLPAAVRRHRPDVIFCAGNTYAVVAVALRLWLGDSCPPIVMKVSNDLTRRDLPAPIRWCYRRWLRIQGRFIDHFTGMFAPMRAEIAEAMQVQPERVSIIEDPALTAADLDRLVLQRRPRVWAQPGRKYVAVGRLVAQKNFALLIEAFADIATVHDRLTILGEGPQRRRLKRLARQLGVAGRVSLPGHADPLGGDLANADVFVLSSNYEGVPAVVIEALAAGLPIVATDCCTSMVKLLDHGRLGRLVPVGDRARLGRAIREVLTLTTCPACALAQARRFVLDRAAPRYLGLLTRLGHGDAALPTVAGAGLARCAVCRSQRRLSAETQLLTEA